MYQPLISIIDKPLSGDWGEEATSDSSIPVIRTTNFTNEGYLNLGKLVFRSFKKNIDKKYLQYGDVIIEKSGGSDKQPVGRVVFFDKQDHTYICNNFTSIIRVKDKNVWLPKYVFYFLLFSYNRGKTRRYENRTTGIHNLKLLDYLESSEIKHINIEKQQRCCLILDKIREIINGRETIIKKLDELVKSRLLGRRHKVDYPR